MSGRQQPGCFAFRSHMHGRLLDRLFGIIWRYVWVMHTRFRWK